MGARPLCRHCGVRVMSRAKGLCWTCGQVAAIRDAYPSVSKWGRRGVRNFPGPAPLPPGPTDAMPGTAAKLAVMESRAAAGYELHHPGDARG